MGGVGLGGVSQHFVFFSFSNSRPGTHYMDQTGYCPVPAYRMPRLQAFTSLIETDGLDDPTFQRTSVGVSSEFYIQNSLKTAG